MFKLHVAAVLGNVPKVQKLLEVEANRDLICKVNSHRRTPLHECARGDAGAQSAKVAQLLLQHVDPEKLVSYLKQVDDENSTALYYAVNNSNTNLVELLLEAEASTGAPLNLGIEGEEKEKLVRISQCSTKDGPESLMYLATSNGSLPVLKLLLKYGYTIDNMEYGKLLEKTVIKKNSANHLEVFKYLADLMIESEILEEVQELDQGVKYILHYAAQCCNFEILQAIASHPTLSDEYFPFLRRRDQFTPIHYTLKSWNDDKFFECVRLLLDKCFNSGYEGLVLYEELYNSKESPLNFAFAQIKLHNAPYYVVEAIVENLPTRNPECWDKIRTNESIVSRFYEWTPQIVPKLINQSTKLLNVESVQIDFGCVIPVLSAPAPEGNSKSPVSGANRAQPETRYLRKILGKEPSVQKSVLLHPVVKMYLGIKYKSFYPFNLFCCLLQVVFLGCYTYLIPAKYSWNDEGNNNSSMSTSCECEKTTSSSSESQNDMPMLNTLEENSMEAQTYLNFLLATIILGVYVVPVGVKELWQMLRYRCQYFMAWINWVQLINIVFVFLVCLECYWNVTILYPVAAVSGLLSWVLFLRELSKIFTECNIWSSALLKVVKRSVKLGIYFLPLLAGFYLAFRVLIPWRSFNYWLSGVGHMLILMTGEFEYDETFNNDTKTTDGRLFLATSSFLLFVMVIVISLSNLLVAVAVEDISKLRRDSEFKSLASRLEYMFNLEIVYLTLSNYACVKWFLDCPSFLYKKTTKILVKISDCFCGGDDESQSPKKNATTMSLEIPEDGILIVPRNLFSADELNDMGLT